MEVSEGTKKERGEDWAGFYLNRRSQRIAKSGLGGRRRGWLRGRGFGVTASYFAKASKD